MKQFTPLAVVAIAIVALPGCGGPEAVMKELIANINRWAEVVEKGESVERQQAAADRVRTTLEKLDRTKLTPDERAKLFQKYEKELNEAGERLDRAMAQQTAKGGPVAFPNFSGWKTPKTHIKELLTALNAWADIVEKHQTEEEQKLAADRVQTIYDQFEKLKMTPEEKDKLLQENQEELNKATDRLRKGVESLQKEGKPYIMPNYSWQRKRKPKE